MTGGSHPLPFEKLAPLEFERLCLWLVRREGYERAEHLGEAGSEQGRDVVAWKDGRRVVFQCKRVLAFTVATAKKEIEKLRALPAGEQPHQIVFVVSRTISADTRAAIRTEWGDRETCDFWVGNELDERVKRHPEILREFFQLAPEGAFSRVVRPPLRRTKGRPWLNWSIGLSLLGVVLTLAAWYWPRSPSPEPPPAKPAIYAVRVQVLDAHGNPVEGSAIRVSAGNEPQRTPDGWWEVEIPAAKVPADGRVTIWAEHKDWGTNRATLSLGADPNPRTEIRLKEPESWIRGQVLDAKDRPRAGVRVSRLDGVPDVTTTDAAGRFALKLSVPAESRVRLAASVGGAQLGDSFCYSGRDSCSISLEAR